MSHRIFPPHVTEYEPSSRVSPDTRTPARFLMWMIWQQRTLAAVMLATSLLFVIPSAVMPWILGKAVGCVAVGDTQGMTGWTLALLGAVLVGILGGVISHTAGVSSWLVAMYRATSLTVRKVLQLGHILPRRTPTGEVLSVASSDSDAFGAVVMFVSTAIAAVVSLIVTVSLVISINWRLGLVVLIAAPLMVFSGAPLLRPLGEARNIERSRSSTLTGQATDIVAGLRILRGIGGERTFGDNYARQSQSVKRSSLVSAAWQIGVDSLAYLLSGLLVVVLTWLGVREMRAGRLDIGGLVSFFGYAVFIADPFRTIFTFAQRWVQGMIASAKAIGVLGQASPWPRLEDPQRFPAQARLVDEASGFVAEPGEFTVVVSADPDSSAALADRLGRYLPPAEAPAELEMELKGRAGRRDRKAKLAQRARISAEDAERAQAVWGVTANGIDLSQIPIEDVRRSVLVSDTGAGLFAGTLQQAVDPLGIVTRTQAEQALRVASAEDVFASLPNGWQGRIDERGRGLSGGQRQRIVLARALVNSPQVLVLVEPTSAVDAHTEARIATRLAEFRRGETTIVMSVSPLLLHHADTVVLLVDGVVAARGTHAELLANSPAYREVVTRGEDA